MKSKIILFVGFVSLVCSITACGGQYTCYRCEKTVSSAYYDIDGDIDDVMCKNCAKDYWAPFDYGEYKVK